MGDHPGFLATNPRQTNVFQPTIPTVPPPYKQKKQLMAIVAGLQLNK